MQLGTSPATDSVSACCAIRPRSASVSERQTQLKTAVITVFFITSVENHHAYTEFRHHTPVVCVAALLFPVWLFQSFSGNKRFHCRPCGLPHNCLPWLTTSFLSQSKAGTQLDTNEFSANTCSESQHHQVMELDRIKRSAVSKWLPSPEALHMLSTIHVFLHRPSFRALPVVQT